MTMRGAEIKIRGRLKPTRNKKVWQRKKNSKKKKNQTKNSK